MHGILLKDPVSQSPAAAADGSRRRTGTDPARQSGTPALACLRVPTY